MDTMRCRQQLQRINEHKHSVIDKHLRGEHNPRNKDIRAQEMSSEAASFNSVRNALHQRQKAYA